MTFFQFLLLGNGFMSLLVFLGILSLLTFLERFFFLHRKRVQAAPFIDGLRNVLQRNCLAEALTLCEETSDSIAQIAKTALINIDSSREQRQRQTQATALLELVLYERRIGILNVLAKITPITGFLGTLLGFFNVFRKLEDIGAYAGANIFAEDISSCIALAAAGLLIAIFSHLFYHFLYGRSRALIHEMEWAYNHILHLTDSYLRQNPPAPEKTHI